MDFHNSTMITAGAGIGLGSLTLFWNQAKELFVRFYSIFVVSVEVVGDADNAMLSYLWNNFKVSRLGDRRFTGLSRFIRSKNRYGRVAFEMTGKTLTFYKGYRPIFVAGQFDKDGNGQGVTRISFIRGTYDIETLLVESMNSWDEKSHSRNNISSRYYVRKCFGRAIRNGKDDSQQLSSKDQPKSFEDLDSLRPLFYKKADLGAPTEKDPFDNLAYSKNVSLLETDIRRWHSSREWFKERGIPWRLGAGLYGSPGTGKTSFVRAIAQDLDLPIHVYDLTTMDNQELVEFWSDSLNSAPCIVLFEDIDRIFDKDKNVKTNKNKSPLTLDCLLNCINGVQAADGILVMLTANDITKIDPALGVPDETGKSTRPGRLDSAVYFGPLDKEGREKIAKRILKGYEHLIDDIVVLGDNESGAQFENRCSKVALEEYWKDTKKVTK